MSTRLRLLIAAALLSPLAACVTPKPPPPEPPQPIYLSIPGSFTQPARRDEPRQTDDSAAAFVVPVPQSEALPPDVRRSTVNLDAIDIGPPPSNYQDLIRAFMGTRLSEPDKVRYRFGQIPQKGRRAAQEGLQVSWFVVAAISQVNASGQYDGEDRYYFFFEDGAIVDFRNFDADLRRMAK